MIVRVNGMEAAKTSSSKIIPYDSKQEAALFVAAYQALGFENVVAEAESKGPQSVKKEEPDEE